MALLLNGAFKMKFKEGKIISMIYVEKNGKKLPIVFRYPKKSDVREAWKFYNKVIKETEFLSRITPVSLKDEKKWIDTILAGMKKGNKVQLFTEYEGRIIGSASVERKSEERLKHVGGFGICILQEFTGVGIDTLLMRGIEKSAMDMNLKIMKLSVYGKNKIGIGLYRKMGFKIAGRIPKAVKTSKGFDDDVIMYKVLKS